MAPSDAPDSARDGYERVDAPRGDLTREWELFVREEPAQPLRHVGSVSAPAVGVAREQATKLVGRWAETVWLCPADETVRLVSEGTRLADRTSEHSVATDDAENP